MNWLIYAFLGAALSAVWSLSVKQGLHSVFATDFSSGYVSISALLLTIINLFTKESFSPQLWGIISGFCQAIAGIALTLSFKTAPNPGLSMSVFRTQALLTSILSYFLFGAQLSFQKIIAMMVVVLGVYLVSKTKTRENKTSATADEEIMESFTDRNGIYNIGSNPKFIKIREKLKNSWLLLALIAGIAMSLKDVTTKKAIVKNPKNLGGILWNTIIVQAILMVIYDKYITGNFGWRDVNGDGKVDIKDKLTIGWTGAIFMLYIITVIKATKLAPNVGYAKAIDTFGVIVTTIASHYLFNEPITSDSIIGIALIVGGISYISLT